MLGCTTTRHTQAIKENSRHPSSDSETLDLERILIQSGISCMSSEYSGVKVNFKEYSSDKDFANLISMTSVIGIG